MKRKKHLFSPATVPAGRDLEHRTILVGTAGAGRAVEIAGGSWKVDYRSMGWKKICLTGLPSVGDTDNSVHVDAGSGGVQSDLVWHEPTWDVQTTVQTQENNALFNLRFSDRSLTPPSAAA